jgi:hypothetical protein
LLTIETLILMASATSLRNRPFSGTRLKSAPPPETDAFEAVARIFRTFDQAMAVLVACSLIFLNRSMFM